MFITFMEVENNMYSFINHKALSHLAIPFFYFVNNENIIKNTENGCLYDPKCISDNLFDTFCKYDEPVIKPKTGQKKNIITKRNKKQLKKRTRRNKI
jgi:hypothetical protein